MLTIRAAHTPLRAITIHVAARVMAAALFVAATACGGADSASPTQPPAQDGSDIAKFVSQVASADLQATALLRPGAPPAAAAGPTVSAQGAGTTILGGSSLVSLQGSAAFTRVIIAVEGVSGYYELVLPSAASTAQVVVTVPQQLPRAIFNILYAVADAAGAVSAYGHVPVNVQTVGTGDVQVSVSWDAASDVDLHVVDPSGEDIFYGNPAAASSGVLDLDSNAACSLDHVNNENITFPSRSAPHGRYTVRVDYWSSCGVPQTKYVVTVRVAGRPVQTFSGTLTGQGDEGAAGAGSTIATFDY